MHLSKHHGLGNDFLVVLDERNGVALDIDADCARCLCERHLGIGADGLLHGSAPSAGNVSDVDVVMELFNSDGSLAEMSGNGIRCFAQAVAIARGIDEGALRVLTGAGVRLLGLSGGPSARDMVVRVDMGSVAGGPPVPDALDVPGERCLTVELGNPHLVVLVGDQPPSGRSLAEQGTRLQAGFESGINVEFARVLTRDRVELTVWERGAGATLACGTGATATAWALRQWDLVGDTASVSMPGGDVEVTFDRDGRATLVGPTHHVADLEVPW